MAGFYKRLEYPPKLEVHQCHTPGALNRWLNSATLGAIWRCDCGIEWIYAKGVFNVGLGESITATDWQLHVPSTIN